jgi:hypothetical protein
VDVEEMEDLEKVLRMVCVKIIVKPTMTAKEQRPPLADLNSGFSLYLRSSVVLKRSQEVTTCFVRLKAL